MKRILTALVATACLCALIVRVTRLVRACRACRADVIEYRVVEFAKYLHPSDGLHNFYPRAYAPELHRYVVAGGLPFREVYRQGAAPFWHFKLDEAAESGYAPIPKARDFHKYPEWHQAISALRTRIANGEKPDEFVALERLPL